jgi:hypothetical protein
MSHQQIVQCVISQGRRALGRGGPRIDPMMSLRKVAMRVMSAGHVCRVG